MNMVMWDANAPVCCSRSAPVRAAAMRVAVAGDALASTANVGRVPRATGRTQTHAGHFSTCGFKQINPLSD